MAWSSPERVLFCVVLLCCVRASHQSCPSSFPDINVEEGESSKGRVLLLYGNDTISNLTLQDDADGYLAINVTTDSGGGHTFTLYLAKEVDMEVLKKDTLEGLVVCADSISPQGYKAMDLIVGLVGMNQHPPEFIGAPYTQSIPEDSATGTTVFQLAGKAKDTDYPPANQIVYAIISNSSPFQMNNGDIVILTRPLDYETGPTSFSLNISAVERVTSHQQTSYTTLTIQVTDVDDVGPVFSHNATFSLALPEQVYQGEVFTTQPAITAHDGDTLNAEVLFELDPSTEVQEHRFTVLTNGSLQVTGRLDPGQFTLNVRAYQTDRPTDRFSVASVTVTVYDVNNNSPVMSSVTYSGDVLEGSPPGTVVLTVSASDADQGANSSFQFHVQENGSVPFSVSTDHTVGILTVSGPLDRETRQFYLLHVYAEEDQTAEKKKSNLSVVNVTVQDVNDNNPVFHGQPYRFSLNQTALVATPVGRVNATDADSGNNGEITYSINANDNPATVVNAFSVDSTTGVITLARNLTQQDVGVVFFDVKADDKAPKESRRWQSTRVKVTIDAVNQNYPEFTSAPYTFTVAETVQKGVSVGVISATDQDSDHLDYWLTNSGSYFRLEGDPPSLMVNGSLDRDADDSLQAHVFGVVVSDGEFESTASVTVSVTMVNEYAPEMGQAVYFAAVKENNTRGDDVVVINATDRDRGLDGEVTFSISSPPEGDRGPFAVNATTGLLSLLPCQQGQVHPYACLDYDVRRQYTLVILATDGGSPAMSAYCTVIVNVEDVNNRAPFFSPVNITGSVYEDAKSGTSVLRLQATDEDTPSSDLTYTLENVSPAGWVVLKGPDLVTNGSLDAETEQHITATVTVSDGSQTTVGFLNVTVLDVNDNYPQISVSSSSVDVPENATVGTHVMTVTARDRDVTHRRSFLFYFGASPSGKFAINSSSGEITVAAPFDRRLQKDYDVTVTVSDNSAPPKMNSTTLHVVITDSNSAPVFVDASGSSVALYSFNISEEEPVGSVVGRVTAQDPDTGSSGQVRYTIDSGNEQGTFGLDGTTGRLSLQQKLDHEQKASYRLVVVATDNSYEPKNDTATVTVTVGDVVEAPQWPDSLPNVHLTANSLCKDVQVNARPQDILQTSSSSPTAVVYSLLNYTHLFLINSDTGLLQRNGSLEPGNYTLGLRACSVLDENVCSDTVLTVTVSDDDVITFCPPFLTVNVNESVPVGHLVVDMNSTKGDNHTTYSILTADPQLPFAINESSGTIVVSKSLDRERTPQYTVEVLAHYHPTDAWATAQVTVVIGDAHDWPPSFLQKRYDGQISEAARMGDPVLTVPAGLPLRVYAEDKDIDPTLTYSVLPAEDNSGGAFTVNSTTGAVTLQRTVDLENMTASLNGLYTLTVMVTDGYFTDNATVVVRVLNDNDNSPRFVPDVLNFNVSEAQHPGFDVAQLTANDLDEGDTEDLRYSLVSSDPDVPFAVSPSGILRLSKKLDRETSSSYHFTVAATDPGGRNGTAQVNIFVMDTNESPQFENTTYVFHVTEGPAGLSFESSITAVDGDLGNNAALTYHILRGDQMEAFNMTTVDGKTGMLSVTRELDREETPTLTLTVIAVDAGQSPLTATCTVVVKVVDINDNDPRWSSDTYRAVISEGSPDNTPVQVLPVPSVTDADEGEFGRDGVVFSLYPSFPDVPFRMDNQSGKVRVALVNASEGLDREVNASYTLTLLATDDNGHGRNGSATLVISLSNVNDHPPAFTQTYYRFHVSEDASVGQLVATLNATDSDNDHSDSNVTAPLTFHLQPPGDQSGSFFLDPVYGNLKVAGKLDRETQNNYVLDLGVSDGQFWGYATANITVDDVNDNCPNFAARDPLTLNVTENQEPHVIYTFNVTDRDAGSNADVTLFINDTSAGRYLAVSEDGALSTRQRLDREKDDQHSFFFTVWARDDGTPPCVASQRVRVEVLGDNEDTPLVCQIPRLQQCGSDIEVRAFDKDPEGTFLAALTWRDSDDGEGGQVTLSLEQDVDGLLALNHTSATTRVLTLARALDKAALTGRGVLENNATYRALVRAQDGGARPRNSSVHVVLTVQALSPTTPAFPSPVYHFSVRENRSPTVIGHVEATAQDGVGPMDYSQQSTSDFIVDRTGNISTVRELDRETKDQYTFIVLAWASSGSSETATAVVVVQVLDENDNSPKFSGGARYDLVVPENVNSTTLMTFVATDDDTGLNGDVTFSFLGKSFDGVFGLNGTTGRLWLNQSLDRETRSSYTLHVEARDRGSPSRSSRALVHITVMDVNDNAPQFSEQLYVGYLDEKAPAATLVKNVTATDADTGLNGQVLYELMSDGSTDLTSLPFYINEFSGVIYTSRALHYSTERTFDLTVDAHDLGSPALNATARVRILVNDLSLVLPRVLLQPSTVGLVLGTPAGTLLPVNVSGGFGSYNFSIVGGNEDDVFTMDKDSGDLTVTRELTKTTTYHLTIRVVNLEYPQYYSDGTLTVIVTSVKLEQERYAAVVPENQPPPFLLLDINSNAEGAGVPVTYRLHGQDIAGVFSIVAGTGQVYCQRSLDRERRAEYTMTVTVQLTHDLSLSAGRRRRALSNEAEIRVIVDDVNDNPPTFDVTSNLFGIPSTAPASTVVTTLQAIDPDAGTNGGVVYSATGGDTATFYVTAEGEVTSRVAMGGRQSGEQFKLWVNATDNQGLCAGSAAGGDTKCLSTSIELTIVVVPDSDRFGLVANITVSDFRQQQQFYLRNLSDILDMTVQLDKVEPHQGTTVDISKSDIYFYAFDNEGKPVPYSTVNERVTANAAAIHSLFNLKSVQLIPVTQPPTRVRVETKSVMGEAEIAVIVVASLIFVGSFVAIILTMRAWKKQKEFQKREEAAARARQKLEQETRELADKMQETSFVADPEEPLELYRAVPVARPVVTEEQECVMNFDNEGTGVDTLVLRREVLRRTEAMELEAILKADHGPSDTNDVDSGTENINGSLSSEEQPESGSRPMSSPAAAREESREPSTTKSLIPPPPPLPSEPSSHHGAKSEGTAQSKDTAADNQLGISKEVKTESKPNEPRYENVQMNSSTAAGGTPDKRGVEHGLQAGGTSDRQDVTLTQQGQKTEDASAEVTTGKNDRPEDPEPDYQKRVSFANILAVPKEGKDVKKDADDKTSEVKNSGSPMHSNNMKEVTKDSVHEDEPRFDPQTPQDTNYLSATSKLLDSFQPRKSEGSGVQNPAFQADEAVLDGWSEDYDNKARFSDYISTAL
ncbi:protocadherin Fat 4-like [Babylonia areolata]|uniref:protocadherin Fat 4-like n=1 Tax=Babylonia areolata TaxID=304850 RepID=UPI003FD34D1D